jgi:HAD superfamily hydrolase (TIGR01509 family)
MEPRFELIIFDCDGVLVDSEPIINLAYQEALNECGFRITSQEYMDRFSGMSDEETFRIIEQQWGRPLPADFERRVTALVDARCETSLTTTPGVDEALAAIRIPVCVASSGVPDRIRTSLRIVGLLDHFEPHLFSATAVQRGKPAPDLFLHAARSMGAARSRCLVVEDSVPGVQAGIAAGMTVIGYCGGGHCRADHADILRGQGATRIIADMRELISTIEQRRDP